MGTTKRALQLAVIAALLWSGVAFADESEEVDHVALAAVLMKDGYDDRARSLLAQVDLGKEGVDTIRYHTMSGLLALRAEEHEKAAKHFEAALKEGQTDKLTWVFLAQARFASGDAKGTIAALDKAGPTGAKLPGSWMLRAQAHLASDDKAAAWRALDAGVKAHPGEIVLRRQRLMLLVQLGLFQAAREEGERFLEYDGATVDDRVALAEALRRSGDTNTAILFLEEARLRHPDHGEVVAQLARCYLDADKPLAAASLFEQAARLDPAYALDAAELYRRAGAPNRAVRMNALVGDQKKKMKQRVGILIDQRRYEEAAAMQPRLLRLGLLDDDNMRYALAYAKFRVGELKAAEALLDQVQDREVFRRAAALRQAMAVCARDKLACE